VTLRREHPVPMRDLLDLYAAIAPMKPVNARAALLQAARADSEGWRDEAGEILAAALFYPLPPAHPGERHVELAFACRPALKDHLLSFVRAAELTRARLALNGPVRVRALVRTVHRPGARLAALVGMTRTGTAGAFDVWEFEGKPDDRVRQGDQIPVHGA
jgi:hypothetical protein